MATGPSTPSASPEVEVSPAQIRGLDLAPLAPLAGLAPQALVAHAGSLRLTYTWPRGDEDPREQSEIPELRLWTLRADALHPWLPLLLERAGGTLTRHVAMLLPHGFSRTEGIRFAPESLDLWITQRLFLLDDWSRRAGLDCRGNLAQMAAVLGFDLDPAFWSCLPDEPRR